MDKNAAASKFSDAVDGILKTPGLDVGTISMLQGDQKRALGQDAGDTPSFGQAMLGHTGFTPEMSAQINAEKAAEDLMAANPGQFVYAPTNGKGAFDPTGQGPVGIVSAGAIPPDSVAVPVPGLGGSAHVVMIQPHDIVADDPYGGSSGTLGTSVSYNVGGHTITLYQYRDASGQLQTTDVSPLATGAACLHRQQGRDPRCSAGYGDWGPAGAGGRARRAIRHEPRCPDAG